MCKGLPLLRHIGVVDSRLLTLPDGRTSVEFRNIEVMVLGDSGCQTYREMSEHLMGLESYSTNGADMIEDSATRVIGPPLDGDLFRNLGFYFPNLLSLYFHDTGPPTAMSFRCFIDSYRCRITTLGIRCTRLFALL